MQARSDSSSSDPAAPREAVSFTTRGEFRAAIMQALQVVADQGCKELIFCDPDYADWPLGDRETVDLLGRWAMSHRTLVVLAAHFETVQRIHPRFVEWRRTWSHVVHCRQAADADLNALPTLLHAPGVLALRSFDRLQHRGRLAFTRPEEVRDRDEVDAYLQRSHESFPVTPLGL